MKSRILPHFLLGLLTLLGIASPAKAEGLYLYNDVFTFNNLPVGLSTTAILSGRWGKWDPATLAFSQQITDSSNLGYVDLASPGEITVSLSQIDNTVYSVGTQLSLALFAVGTAPNVQTQNFAAATHAVILQDPSWIVPLFTNVPDLSDIFITANTSAVFGSFNFNGGNEIFTMAVIPEPSSMSLVIMGLATALAFRRKCASIERGK